VPIDLILYHFAISAATADIAKFVQIIENSPHARACMDLELPFAFLD